MMGGLRPTPFHARTSAQNFVNAWTVRGAFTVPAHYIDPGQEALAARLTAAVIDISARQDLRIEGEGAAPLLSAACGVRGMKVGHSEAVHWCSDGGGLRGCGVVSRLGEHEFLLRSADADIGWFSAAAARLDASVRDVTAERGLLLLAGPYAIPVMVAARLEVSSLEPNRHATIDWLGVNVTIFHCARPRGYEIACAADDATLVFDRLFRLGHLFRLRLAGEEALQLLELEAGLTVPYVDYTPAREPFARVPSPAALGVAEARRAGEKEGTVLAGIELDSDEPMAFAPVFSRNGNEVGRTMRSLYSPALKSAIALAELSPAHASSGTAVKVLRIDSAGPRELSGRVVTLPFL